MCFGTTHHLNPQGKGTVRIFITQSREAPVETAVMTFTALLGSSAFQLFFTAAGTGHRIQKVPALNCIEIILYLYCQALLLLAGWHVLC